MTSASDSLIVALAQTSPVWLDRAATLDKMQQWIVRAAQEGAQLVTFSEGFLPGYPFWLEHTDAARFESALQKRLYAHYVDQAVDIEAGGLEPLCTAAARAKLWVVFGCIERSRLRGQSVFASMVTIDADGRIRNVHRKLMPTYEERLAWAPGDGHGLRCFDIGRFRLGSLNCWENWMPLARAALYAQGEDLHIASWPGSRRNTETITPFIAREGRSFALSISSRLHRDEIPTQLPDIVHLRSCLPDVMANGGSCIAGPDGEWLIEPANDEDGLLLAELDHARVRSERQNFDPFGHYSRPDVLELHVDQRRRSGLVIDPVSR